MKNQQSLAWIKSILQIYCILLFQLATLSAQQTKITNFVLFGRSQPFSGQATPAAPGYGVQFGSSTTIQGGSIGSYSLINTTGNVSITGNIYSRGTVYLSNSNSITGRIAASNSVQSQAGVAEVGMNQNEIDKALPYYMKAQASAQEIEAKPELKDLYEKIAKAFALKRDYTKAYQYQSLYSAIKGTIFNEDIENKLGTLQFDFDLQKKQTEINQLTKDKAITDQKLERQRLAKTTSLVGLAMVFLIATLLYRNYRIQSITNQVLDRQKGEIEQLLLNILPIEVANELKLKGHTVPKYYESVAVMFTDFQGFTFIAEKLTPQDLLQELNTCFIAFDHISEKYNLEKIKTIGDSYMVAGFDSKGRESREVPQNGIMTKTPGEAPVINHTHIENIINASLEIRDFMKDHNASRKKEGRDSWELRIGVHIGPVIAGVVGLKKYAYDIWGLTVNTASRMESNGEPGQVNVSSSVYELIQDNYICKYRGKINAKNIGEIDMYFVEGLKLG